MQLHAHTWGDGAGDPIVCVHGVTGHSERFRRLAEERLPDRRVLAVDLRGHGRSAWEPPWNLETHVADLADTAAVHAIERATWIGYSLGGRLTTELALRDPWRVSRLILLDPALHLDPAFALEAAEDERVEETYASADEAIEARYSTGSLISTPREMLEEEMGQHLEERPDGRLGYRYSRSAAIAAWGEMSRPPVPPADVPTLIVLGTESHVPVEPHVGRYAAALGERFEVRRIESGHTLLWDAFDETAEAIGGFA